MPSRPGLPGMSGNLNAAGEATASLQIPNSGALVGRTFLVAMYTKSSAGDPTIRTVSEAVPVTVLP